MSNGILEQAIIDLVVHDIENEPGLNIIANDGAHLLTDGVKIYPSKEWIETFRKHLIKLFYELEVKGVMR